jgi:hypothetical protein
MPKFEQPSNESTKESTKLGTGEKTLEDILMENPDLKSTYEVGGLGGVARKTGLIPLNNSLWVGIPEIDNKLDGNFLNPKEAPAEILLWAWFRRGFFDGVMDPYRDKVVEAASNNLELGVQLCPELLSDAERKSATEGKVGAWKHDWSSTNSVGANFQHGSVWNGSYKEGAHWDPDGVEGEEWQG